MANKQRAFTEIKTMADFKYELDTHPNYVFRAYFNSDSLEYALNGLNIMTDENEEAFLGFVHHIDKTLSMAGTAHGNRFHKIPTALAGAIFYAYCPETIEGLTYDEIAILAKFAIPETFDFYETSAAYFGKDLLATIHSIGEDFMYHSMYMELADYKLKQGQTKEEVTSFMKDNPLEQVKQEAFDYAQAVIEIAGRYL